ncbi:unnamed protein product [Closterium sp. Naga37s-1]|nr:unnamed protein product [Closterium sp. Naga37s-1]
MAPTAGAGTAKMLSKLEASVKAGNFYEAQQLYKSVSARYLSKGGARAEDAVELLQSGASVQLQQRQVTCGTELALLLVDALSATHTAHSQGTVERLLAINDAFKPLLSHQTGSPAAAASESREQSAAPEAATSAAAAEYESLSAFEGCLSFLKAAIRWSLKAQGAPRHGAPELHDALAVLLWTHGATQDLEAASRHFVLGRDTKAFSSVLCQVMQEGFPDEVDLVLARAVLQYLAVGNIKGANELMDDITARGAAGTAPALPDSPLIHFTRFLLLTVERDALPLFLLLRKVYAPSIRRDPQFHLYLDEIAHRYYKVARPSGGGDFMGGLLQVRTERPSAAHLVKRVVSQMDSFNEGSSPRQRRLDPDPFPRLSDDLVAHILALVASNGFRFHPKPRLTTAAASSCTTTATAAAEPNAGGAGGDGASAERDDGMARNVGNAVKNGSANSEDADAHGDDASEDELLQERIARAVKNKCARFVRVIQLPRAIALEAEATAANYARTMTLQIEPDNPDTPSAEHILASAYPLPLSGTSADSAPFPPPLPPPPPSPPPPFTVFRHALVCKRWLRLARFSLPAILLQADRRLSTQTFRSFLSSPPPLPLTLSPPTTRSASAASPFFPLHSPLTLRHLHIGPSALDAITDELLNSIATGCASSLTHLSLYRHMNLHSWDQNFYGSDDPDDPDDAVAKVTEPAVTALFAACRRLVSLKLVLPMCLPELPASVSLLQRLTRLDVSCGRDDRDSRPLPEPEGGLPESVGSLSALQSLRIRAAYARALPPTLSRLRSLTSLKVDGCFDLWELPDGLGQLKNLRYLELAKLDSLESLPDSIGLLSSLETLHLRGLSVSSLPDSSDHLSSLKRLFLSHLAHLRSLPDSIGELPSLQELTVKFCARLTALPPSLSALSSLTALTVQHCKSLASLPEDIGDVPRLASLVLDQLPALAAIPDSLALLSSLTHLHAANCVGADGAASERSRLRSARFVRAAAAEADAAHNCCLFW